VPAAASAGDISADARLVYLQQRRLLSRLPLPKARLLLLVVVGMVGAVTQMKWQQRRRRRQRPLVGSHAVMTMMMLACHVVCHPVGGMTRQVRVVMVCLRMTC
jgi:hypothetical protein